jgi:hypothetical protein
MLNKRKIKQLFIFYLKLKKMGDSKISALFNKTSGYTTRTKGARAVKDPSKVAKEAKETDAAHTKLFQVYLNNNAKTKNKAPDYKLGNNHTYYSNLLRNNNRLQYMNMAVLSQVLLYLNSRDGVITEENLEEDTSPFIDNLIGRSYNSTTKNLIKTEISDKKDSNPENDYLIMRYKMILEFFKYLRFVKILEVSKDNNIEKEEPVMITKGTMIHPQYEEL